MMASSCFSGTKGGGSVFYCDAFRELITQKSKVECLGVAVKDSNGVGLGEQPALVW